MASKMRGLFYAFFVVLLLVGCSGGTGSSTKGNNEEGSSVSKELNVAFHEDPGTLDTHVTSSQSAGDISANIFEGLLTTDSEGNIQPMLAESWEQSDDAKEVTFKLREGILFHNGKEMTADDVVASMNRWIELSTYGRSQFAGTKFEKVDDYTVKFILDKPISTALTMLAFGGGNFSAIMPKEAIEGGDETGVKEFIGTGPFKIEEYKQDQYVHLKKFEDYKPRSEKSDGAAGAREALVDDAYIHFVKDPSTRVAGILSGEYDVAIKLPTNNVEPLKTDSNVDIHVKPSGNLEFYFNKKKGLFTDKNARHAVAAGLDMEEIMQNAFSGEEYYELTHNFMLKSQADKWDSDTGKDLYNVHDVEKAKEFLAKTDYNGEEITILTMRSVDLVYKSTVVLQQQLEEIGIKSKLEVVDRPTYDKKRVDENAYDIFPVTNIVRPEPTSSPFFMPGQLGFTDNKDLEEKIAEFRSKKSIEEAMPLYEDIQAIYWDYLPIIKPGDMTIINVTRKGVDNFQYNDAMTLYNVGVN